MNVNSLKLPKYFYNIEATLPNGKMRWYDEFHDPSPSIIRPGIDTNPRLNTLKYNRNMAYAKWQAAFFARDASGGLSPLFKAKPMSWQAIRVLAFKHSESSSNDWWEKYQDAVFRVFVSPETCYDQASGEHKQWYLLSPEDCFLVNEYEASLNGKIYAPRDYSDRERYLSAHPQLRRARFIPVECCHHLRHETTAGELPGGL